MKKIIIYLICILLIFFILPSTLTKNREKINKTENEKINEVSTNDNNSNKYEYSRFNNIRLYHSKTSEIENLEIEEYLYGVVSSEMPVNFEFEALKAQAIVARTYTIYQILHSDGKHQNADICDDFSCCQAWISKKDRLSKWNPNDSEENWLKIVNAVNSTQGKIIVYKNEPIDAFFHSNSGGITENVSSVWGGKEIPYLQSVETSGESEYSQYSSTVEMSQEELLEKLKKRYSDIQIDYSNKNDIQILEYTGSGRIKTIKFGNITISGTEARTILGLKSTNFNFQINENKIIFSVIGYGHGVGMSQTGANSMAKNGSTAEEIIKHFYSDVNIVYANDI